MVVTVGQQLRQSAGADVAIYHRIRYTIPQYTIYRVIFLTGSKVQSTKKLIYARLGVSRTIYVNVDTPNLGFTYFNFNLLNPVEKVQATQKPTTKKVISN